jgi:hypothetical protein
MPGEQLPLVRFLLVSPLGRPGRGRACERRHSAATLVNPGLGWARAAELRDAIVDCIGELFWRRSRCGPSSTGAVEAKTQVLLWSPRKGIRTRCNARASGGATTIEPHGTGSACAVAGGHPLDELHLLLFLAFVVRVVRSPREDGVQAKADPSVTMASPALGWRATRRIRLPRSRVGPRRRGCLLQSRTTFRSSPVESYDLCYIDAMPLSHRSMLSNEVRVPDVPRGEVVIVGRYSEKTPKVALINPEDLAMLEDSHNLLKRIAELEELPVDELTLKTLAIEDRPDAESITDPSAIAAILDL